jgi:hypothetical protein
MTYEKVPPDDHRRNIAEKAIQTWKDHFVAVLSGTAETFPLHLWCQLLPQMERQLNLLGNSNTIPHISTYAQLHGHHDYNARTFVPLGMEALTHDKPHQRKHSRNIAARDGYWVPRQSITGVGRCGRRTQELQELLAGYFLNTNTSPIHM